MRSYRAAVIHLWPMAYASRVPGGWVIFGGRPGGLTLTGLYFSTTAARAWHIAWTNIS